MKQTLLVMAEIAVFLCSPAFSRVSLMPGGTAGPGFFREEAVFPDEVDLASSRRTTFLAGGVLEIGFSKYFSIQPEILYAGRGGGDLSGPLNFSSGGITEDAIAQLNYLEMPINLRVKWPVTPIVSPYILAGADFSYLLYANTHTTGNGSAPTDKNETSKYKSFALGYNVGLGAEFQAINFRPFIEIVYYHGLTDILIIQSNYVPIYDEPENTYIKCTGLQVKVGLKYKIQ